MPQNIDDLSNTIEDVTGEVVADLEETFDDVGGQLQELKGILSEALGDLPFKLAIVLIVLFNLIYTFYHAFFTTRIDNVIESDCYCDPIDRAFYRTLILVSTMIWICILSGYALISTLGHGHFIRFNEAKRNKAAEKIFSNLTDIVATYEKSFQGKLRDIVSTKILDYDYCKAIEDYYASQSSKRNKHVHSQSTEKSKNFKDFYNQKGRKQPKRWRYYMCSKILLIVLRFIFRLLIVPLLQLQWFNEYAWNCLMNNVIRNYCEAETSQYYIGLDHTFVLYSVYVLLLIALLFSIIINWFPRGTPEVAFQYEALDAPTTYKVNINKKGEFTYCDSKLVNEGNREHVQ